MVPSGIGAGIQAAGAIASGEMVPNKVCYRLYEFPCLKTNAMSPSIVMLLLALFT